MTLPLLDSIQFKALKKVTIFAVLSPDLDECNSSVPVCHVSATCQNTIGSYRCLCSRIGFIYRDREGCVGKYSMSGYRSSHQPRALEDNLVLSTELIM